MTNLNSKIVFITGKIIIVFLSFQILSCKGKVKETSVPVIKEKGNITQPIILNQNTTFPQIHTNLNGMVREFVRTMYQDRHGNYWFGTNGDGIIRYDTKTLEKITIEGVSPHFRVLEIVEDQKGNLWFGTSEGLLKYDNKGFKMYSKTDGLQNEEIWGLAIDKSGLIWIGSIGGVSQFNGEDFIPFALPDSKVENPKPMLSDKLVFKIVEDKNGTMWFATDGNGIFTYNNGKFTHLTTNNGLSDNNIADILEDKQGNVWIGSFYGGISRFDGKTFNHFTKNGIIEGKEAYNLYQDSKGNIWFSAEGHGVYRYDGVNFTQYQKENGLTSNVVQTIFEDHKNQLWFGTWQGLCIFDGEKFVDAKLKEPWTN